MQKEMEENSEKTENFEANRSKLKHFVPLLYNYVQGLLLFGLESTIGLSHVDL